MERDCTSCQRAHADVEFGCGFIPVEQRAPYTYTIPEFKDINMRQDLCPVYTYLENVYIYQFINIAKTMTLDKLSFCGREVVTIYNNYMHLRNNK